MTPEQIAADIANMPLAITPDQREYLATQIVIALRQARADALEEAKKVVGKGVGFHTQVDEILLSAIEAVDALKHKDHK